MKVHARRQLLFITAAQPSSARAAAAALQSLEFGTPRFTGVSLGRPRVAKFLDAASTSTADASQAGRMEVPGIVHDSGIHTGAQTGTGLWWFSIADVTVKFADGQTVTVPGQDGLHGDDRVRSDKFIETVRSAITPEMWPIELDL